MEKIKEAAEAFCETRRVNSSGYPPREWFIAGATSEAAKEYHQRGMYSDEEMERMCMGAVGEFNRTCSSGDFDFNTWFEQNKKK